MGTDRLRSGQMAECNFGRETTTTSTENIRLSPQPCLDSRTKRLWMAKSSHWTNRDGHLSTRQNYASASTPIIYYVFDVLVLAGRDVMAKPLSQRRDLLRSQVLPKLKDPGIDPT